MALTVETVRSLCTNGRVLTLSNLEDDLDETALNVVMVALEGLPDLEELGMPYAFVEVLILPLLFDTLVQNCPRLHTIDLSGNDLGNDGIASITEYLVQLNELQSLVLTSNDLDAEGVQELLETLKKCPKFHSLTLNENDLGAAGLEHIATALSNGLQLQTLQLGSTGAGDEGVQLLAAGLRNSANLQTLSLADNKIGSDGAQALAEALPHCTKLHTLDLADNSLGHINVGAILSVLLPAGHLRTLNLHQTSLNWEGGLMLAGLINQASGLRSLDLSNNDLGDVGVRELGHGMPNGDLAVLNLSGNNIGPNGGEAVASVLRLHIGLERISIASNPLGNDCTKVFAPVLRACRGLVFLDLHGCGLGAGAATSLASGLRGCPFVVELNLGGNTIDNVGATALAQWTKTARCLETLVLEVNAIGDDGAVALAGAVTESASLKTLKLGVNQIDATGATALLNAVQLCPSIVELTLDDNPMEDAAFLTSLQTALETNRLPERVAEARRRREAQTNVAEADTTPDATPGSTPAVTTKPAKTPRDELEEELAAEIPAAQLCPRCFRVLNKANSVLLTKCAHALCRPCADEMLAAGTGGLTCERCATVTPVATAGDLRPHPLIAALPARCSDCGEAVLEDRSLATKECVTCGRQPLCGAHAAERHAPPAHTVEDLGAGAAAAAEDDDDDTATAVHCARHRDRTGTQFCSFCNEAACDACAAEVHRPPIHTLAAVDDAGAAAIRADLAEAHKAARAARERQLDSLMQINDTRSAIAVRDQDLRARLEQTFANLHARLDARYNELTAWLEATSGTEQAAVREDDDVLRRRWTQAATELAVGGALLDVPDLARDALYQLAPVATARLWDASAANEPRVPQPFGMSLRVDTAADSIIKNLVQINLR